VRADVDAADAGQDPVDNGQQYPGPRTPLRRLRRTSGWRGSGNGVVHGGVGRIVDTCNESVPDVIVKPSAL
jgi:hypothetical protein